MKEVTKTKRVFICTPHRPQVDTPKRQANVMEENVKEKKSTEPMDSMDPMDPMELLKENIDSALEVLEKAMDESFIESGKVLAKLFRTVCTTALQLPNMELHTELMCVTNTDEGLSVFFNRRKADALSDDDRCDGLADDYDDCDDYDDDEEAYDDFDEEGRLYDED